MDVRVCTKCGIEKELNKDNFYFMNKKGYFSAQCKICTNKENKIRFNKNKERNKIKKKEYYLKNKEKILKKNRINYNKNREKNLNQIKNYRIKNIDKIKERKRKYYLKNKQEILQKNKEYYIKNYKQKIKKNIEYEKNRKLIDSTYKLKRNFSSLIRMSLKNKGLKKNGDSFIKYMNYTIKELKQHLEKQFEPWMSWDNWGIYNSKTWDDNDSSTWKWNIDHIIPASTFSYTSMNDEEFQKCWELKNLRPLNAKQNVLDGIIKIRHKE